MFLSACYVENVYDMTYSLLWTLSSYYAWGHSTPVSVCHHICCLLIFKALTHQTDAKELATTKADCSVASRRLCLGQKVALEHNAKTTANGQLARTFCACVRGNNSPYQQVAVVCICYSKRDTGRPRTADIYKHETKRLPAILTQLSLRPFRNIAILIENVWKG